MPFHQFGEYFVFCLKFLLQGQYFLVFRPILIFYSIKCPWSMLKKLLLPAIKHCRLELMLFTNIRYRNFLQQMLPYDVYFFIRCIVGLLLTHFLLLFELSNKTNSIQGKFQFTLNQFNITILLLFQQLFIYLIQLASLGIHLVNHFHQTLCIFNTAYFNGTIL